jgi:glycosyltransferase involved in cell wall biosynthesis
VFNSKKALYNFKNIFHEKYYNRLHCIYNGYEIPKEHTEGPSTLIFGSLGRLNIEKNILQAVRVFQEFEKDNLEVHYIIQGHFGNQYETIKQVITTTNIEIRDKTPEIEKFYNSINVLILPSIFEGCPNVLFEALLRKKICIVSKGANSDCFIQNGVNGFVYDGTDNGLFQALQTVQRLFYTHKANEIINNAYHYAVNNFSISTMIAEYENLFLKIYEENKSSN